MIAGSDGLHGERQQPHNKLGTVIQTQVTKISEMTSIQCNIRRNRTSIRTLLCTCLEQLAEEWVFAEA